MKQPRLYDIKKSRDMISAFKGYNHNLVAGENEFYDMKNMVSNNYPVLSSGASWRTEVKASGKIVKLFADQTNNKLSYVVLETNGYYNFYYDGDTKGLFSEFPDSIVMIGSKICVFPAACCYDTVANTFISLASEWSNQLDTGYATFAYQLCDEYGNAYPYSEVEGQANYYLDKTATPYKLKKINTSTLIYEEVNPTYIKISTTDTLTGKMTIFSIGDSVEISNSVVSSLNYKTSIIKAVSDYEIIVEGMIGSAATQSTVLNIKRKIPDMALVIEHGNRLWGCSQDGREIYACKLGEPAVWYDYDTLSTASYAATIGSGGVFTGAAVFQGYVHFFKEDSVCKIYDSNYPAVQIMQSPLQGVEKDSGESVVVGNGVLYYKSSTAIIAYTDSQIYSISDKLGSEFQHYKLAQAGFINNKYYICMRDMRNPVPYNPNNSEIENTSYVLFVYDINNKMWHKEIIDTGKQAKSFVRIADALYFIKQTYTDTDYSDTVQTIQPDVFNITTAHKTEWYAETGDFGMNMPDYKYISQIQIRLSSDAAVFIEIQYDSSGTWYKIATIPQTGKDTITVPIPTRRCDHFKLKFSGNGNTSIFSITKTIEQGGDIR